MKKNNKRLFLNIVAAVLAVALIVIVIWGLISRKSTADTLANPDGIEQVDLDTIYLENSGVEVNFSEVILSGHKETRKLIVSEQKGTVHYTLTDQLIKKLDFDFLKKTQTVYYTGAGYFVVDLDNLTADNVIDDKENKTVIIRIGHAYLQAIEINPNDIKFSQVNEGLLARGKIKLTVEDYNAIEKELRNRLVDKFNVASNGQQADAKALEMVREIYEPIVKAIDRSYSVKVEFK